MSAQFNPKKKLQIEIHSNDMSNANGYTVWHVVNTEKKRAMSRRADGKDFDWMTVKQNELFEKGQYKFTMTAQDASEYFEYIY